MEQSQRSLRASGPPLCHPPPVASSFTMVRGRHRHLPPQQQRNAQPGPPTSPAPHTTIQVCPAFWSRKFFGRPFSFFTPPRLSSHSKDSRDRSFSPPYTTTSCLAPTRIHRRSSTTAHRTLRRLRFRPTRRTPYASCRRSRRRARPALAPPLSPTTRCATATVARPRASSVPVAVTTGGDKAHHEACPRCPSPAATLVTAPSFHLSTSGVRRAHQRQGRR